MSRLARVEEAAKQSHWNHTFRGCTFKSYYCFGTRNVGYIHGAFRGVRRDFKKIVGLLDE
ncbi:hypothetical protein [Vibrio phage vB_VhaP_PG11]|nr:hypothetical protein [Vibrio phage vB_VhaP_PG11]